MEDQAGHRPPLASPAEFNSEGALANAGDQESTSNLPSPGINVEFHGDSQSERERPSLFAHL
jgi:hypothetical protein